MSCWASCFLRAEQWAEATADDVSSHPIFKDWMSRAQSTERGHPARLSAKRELFFAVSQDSSALTRTGGQDARAPFGGVALRMLCRRPLEVSCVFFIRT